MKILIIGPVASGKTTVAKKISEHTGIKHYEIDSIVHNDKNNIKRSENEQINIINQINKNGDWIIEGTLRKNLYILLDLADKVIYIDIPLRIRRRRIILRYLKQKLGIEKCNYIPNKEMLKNMFRWTNDYEKEKNKFERNLRKYKDKVEVFNESSENIFKKFIKTLDNI